jgi:hypothetical protein
MEPGMRLLRGVELLVELRVLRVEALVQLIVL